MLENNKNQIVVKSKRKEYHIDIYGENTIITLTQGNRYTRRVVTVYVDTELLSRLDLKNGYLDIHSNCKRRNDGSKAYYVRYRSKTSLPRLHDLVLDEEYDEDYVVDHRNGNTDDYRKENLRIVSKEKETLEFRRQQEEANVKVGIYSPVTCRRNRREYIEVTDMKYYSINEFQKY